MPTVRMAIAVAIAASTFAQQSPDGAAIYARHCARCHDTDTTGWAERREVLAKLPPAAIMATLQVG